MKDAIFKDYDFLTASFYWEKSSQKKSLIEHFLFRFFFSASILNTKRWNVVFPFCPLFPVCWFYTGFNVLNLFLLSAQNYSFIHFLIRWFFTDKKKNMKRDFFFVVDENIQKWRKKRTTNLNLWFIKVYPSTCPLHFFDIYVECFKIALTLEKIIFCCFNYPWNFIIILFIFKQHLNKMKKKNQEKF